MNTMKTLTSLTDQFLKQTVAQKQSIAIYLINGIKLAGHVAEFGEDIIVLKADSPIKRPPQIVYRHAIATLMLASAITNKPTASKKS